MRNIDRHIQLSIEHEKAVRENITLAKFNGMQHIPQRKEVCIPDDGLWKGIWDRAEVACLFGMPNVGKTILAMQIAANVKRLGITVEYFDLEGFEHPIKPQFTPTILPESDDEDISPLDFIVKKITDKKSEVAIIDDFDLLLNGDDSNANVKHTLNTLRQLSHTTSVAILIIAHSKPAKKNHVVTAQCLPHAYEIMHACDSVFSLSQANRHNATRHQRTHYIKQHKNRMAPVIYDDNCVLTAALEVHDGIIEFSQFKPLGDERQLLRDYGFHSHESMIEAIKQLNHRHYTTREIAAIVGISQSQVSRIISKIIPDDLEPEVIECDQLLAHNFQQAREQRISNLWQEVPDMPLPDASDSTNQVDASNSVNHCATIDLEAMPSLHTSIGNIASDAFDSRKPAPRVNSNSSLKKLMKKRRN